MNATPVSSGRVVVGSELCRLTVAGPARRTDLALPATATLGELLPVVARHTAPEADAGAAWVLQRLGGPPLDAGATAESLDLLDGEVLYLSPAASPLPELDYDDVGVGVAAVLSRRPDYWRPEFSRRLFLGAAVAVAAAFAVLTAAAGPAPTQALWYGLAAVAMVLGAVVAGRLAHDPDLGVVAGLAGCGYAVLAGFAARRGAAGLFTLDRKALLITGCAAAGTAIIVAMAARLPGAVFGTVLGLGIAATAGATMALVFHLTAAAAAAALAVLLYASTTVNLRIALRGARLRVALLPHTSEELQQDIDPEAEAVVTARTSRVTAHLNALFITSALVAAVAAVQLTRERGWIGWALAAALSTAILLRARILTIAWQRAPLAMCGLTGLCLVVVSQVRQLGQPAVSVVLPALLACCAALLIAARRLPGRRLLPIWGQLADHLELWSSILLVPLLLQMFHVYARLRALIN